MASCAKLAGERLASNHMPVLLQTVGLLASRCYGGSATLSHQGCRSFVGQHGIPVMEIVLARSSIILVCALLTVAVRRQDPRGNRQWLLLARSLVGFTGSAANERCTGGTCTLHALLMTYSSPIPCDAACLCRHLPLVYSAAAAATV
jgi:drug/metabolite transporter (DMT)-like permease